jgi:hypothetical protein
MVPICALLMYRDECCRADVAAATDCCRRCSWKTNLSVLGRKEGRKEGRKDGRMEGRKGGRKEGRKERRRDGVRRAPAPSHPVATAAAATIINPYTRFGEEEKNLDNWSLCSLTQKEYENMSSLCTLR